MDAVMENMKRMLWKLWLCEDLYKQSWIKELLSYRIAICQVPEGKITESQFVRVGRALWRSPWPRWGHLEQMK